MPSSNAKLIVGLVETSITCCGLSYGERFAGSTICWLLITVASDLFRRHDISGWVKAIWVISWIVFPYIAVLAYLIFQGRGMAERNVQQAHQARDELRRVVVFSAADEIEKLDRLKQAGSISDAEFARLRARLVQ
jgi:hypothetical protein